MRCLIIYVLADSDDEELSNEMLDKLKEATKSDFVIKLVANNQLMNTQYPYIQIEEI